MTSLTTYCNTLRKSRPSRYHVPSWIAFGGSGTTAGVANALGRDAILCELNPEYAKLIPARVKSIVDDYHGRKQLPTVKPAKGQRNLF